MSRIASTVRLEQDVQEALANLSKVLRRPMNRLINEAVKAYIEQRSLEVEHDLETTLKNLRAYRKRDPGFKTAIAAFIKAEASLEDPVEGKLAQETGSVRKEIHRLLHA